MTDQGSVSTAETPQTRDEITVVTEEKLKPQDAVPAPLSDEPKPDASATPENDKPKSDDGSGDQPRKRNRSAERKIRSLTRKLSEAESRGTASDEKVAALEAELETLKATPPAPRKPKPKLADFKTSEEYAEAHVAWKTESEAPAPKPPAPKKPDPTSTGATGNPDFDELAEEGEKRLGSEFKEALYDQTLPLSKNMSEFIFDSDVGPELVMWLDDHREEAREMFDMRRSKVEAALEEVETGLSGTPAKETPKADTSKRDSGGRFRGKASPPPGDPIGGGVGGTSTNEIQEGLSMDEFAKRRRAYNQANRVR